jgi:hypothetical protein
VRYFRRQEYYRLETAYHFRPADEAVRQFLALRRRLHLEDWEETPPAAGIAFVCRHCSRWATGVQLDGRLLEVGESEHSLNLLDGDCYCPYAKFDKKGLIQSRNTAGCDERPDHASGGAHNEAAEDGEEEEGAPEEEEEEEEEEAEANVEADVAQVEFDAQGLPVLPANVQLANAAADVATKRLATHDRRLLSQALTSLGPSRSTLTQSCGGQPLRAVDMVGLWYKARGFARPCLNPL